MTNPRRATPLRLALPAALALVVGAAIPAAANVERIREMALELEQKLNEHRYEMEIKGKTPNLHRIYKDYDFILKENKVEDAREEKGDPHSDRLALYLTQAIVEFDLSDYEDDLREHERMGMAELDGKEFNRLQMYVRLALAPDDAQRRSIYTAVKPLIEVGNVFRNQIATRRVELYQAQGYPDYNAFYAEREGVDLEAERVRARTFLEGSQALYDELLEWVAQDRMGVIARKVRFPDFPYLMTALEFMDAFPPSERQKRVDGILGGLGLGELGSGLDGWDDERGPDRQIGGGVYPVEVPDDVRAGITPIDAPMDYDAALYVSGVSGLYALSRQTAFEPAYLTREAPAAALGYLVRWVRDEDSWLREVAGLEGEALARYKKHRSFVRLLEARMLAAQVLYETALYGGHPDPEDLFKDIMREAVGSRITSTDAKRSLEFAEALRSVGRFRGLLLAFNIRDHLAETLGETWYRSPEAGAMLRDWYGRGGTLTVQTMTEAAGGAGVSVEPVITRLRSYAAAE